MTIAVWARTNKKIKAYSWSIKWIALSVFIFFFICFVYVWLSTQIVQLGYQITEAIQIQRQLKEQSYTLRSQWSYFTSPAYLKMQAEKQGLQVPKEIFNLP
jgi:hypothetical protein